MPQFKNDDDNQYYLRASVGVVNIKLPLLMHGKKVIDLLSFPFRRDLGEMQKTRSPVKLPFEHAMIGIAWCFLAPAIPRP